VTLAPLLHVQKSTRNYTRELARGHQGLSRGFRHGRGVHDHAKRDHVLLAFVQKHCAALFGGEREPQVPAAYVLDPRKSRDENILHCAVFYKWNMIAVHRKLCLPHRERPAVPPSAQHDGNLNYHKLIVGPVKQFDENVTFRALPLRQVAAP
jgi:hypothetical protein